MIPPSPAELTLLVFLLTFRGRRDHMVVEFTTIYASVPITTDVVSLNLDQGEV